LPQLIGSDASSIQGFEEMLSDAFVFVLFLVDTGVSVVKGCCVGVKGSAVGSDEFVEKILN
jgi:hypothetical protein